MDLSLLYFENLDLITIALCYLLIFPGIFFLLKTKGPFALRDRILSQILFIAPLFIIIGAILFDGARGFAGIRLVYNIGGAVYPILGGAFLFISTRRMESSLEKKASIGLGLICVSLLPLAIWMTFIEPRWMDISETEIRTGAQIETPIRIAVLTDIQTDHFGEWEDRIIEETNALSADLILIPGDLLQAQIADYPAELKKARRFLSRLNAKHGVYIVQGDADRKVSDYVGPNSSNQVQLLFNENRELKIANRTILLSGLELNYGSLAAEQTIRRAEASQADLNIVFAHRPASVEVEARKNSSIDLFIAGHTHGGQIVVPFFGPPITLSPLPRHIGAGGLHKHAGRNIFVSRGLGLERINAPRMRLNCRPELSLLLVN